MGRLTQHYNAASPGTIERPELHEEIAEKHDRGWVVTVYNNDYNTYEEVIAILIIATGCCQDEAFLEAWEVDNLGRSVVHHGRENDCQAAATIIAKIGIRVEVSQE